MNSMNVILLYAHSGWRYVVIFVMLLALVKFAIGWLGRTPWTTWDQRLGLAVPITVDIQVLLGAVLWIITAAWQMARRQAWEHPVTMLLALAVVHGASVLVKRAETPEHRFRAGFLGYLVAAVIAGVGLWRMRVP